MSTLCRRSAKAPAASRVSASVEKKQLTFRQATAEDLVDIKRMVLKERCYTSGQVDWVRFLP